jgi:diaminohydroxyphosphoribosylaminopyrimidine deaminase/5-amino-6-(5-phosphoribosylamino)uracil reductase
MANTLVFTEQKEYPKISGIEYENIDFSNGLVSRLCEVLFERQVQSLIVEGGVQTLWSFLETGLWDEARVFTGDILMQKGLKAPQMKGREISSSSIENDTLRIMRND